ncbi:MAG: hypothetical protein H6739_16690 [Alphaproteobacteria bacterium]|nr:hypothetical protein [Alphaproteobacteria bacterium]
MRRWVTPAALLALAVAWTWPAAVSGGATLVGRHFDLPGTVWFIDAAARVVPSLHDPLTAWPNGADYSRPDSFTLIALAWLTQWASPVAVHNALQVLGVWMSAWAASALAEALGARAPWSWIAGLAFGFCGLASTALLEGHVYHLLDPWLPLFGWAWWRATRADARWWHGALAAVGWSGALLTTAYLGLAASVMAPVFLLGGLLRRELRVAPVAVAAAGVALVGGLYLSGFSGSGMHTGAPYLHDGFPSQIHFMQHGSTNLLSLAAPTPELDRVEHSMSSFTPATVIALVLAAPVALRGFTGWRRVALAGLVALTLSFGPTLFTPRGAWTYLPMALIAELPQAELIRFPTRLGWAWVLCGGVVAARVATALVDRVGWRAWPLLALVILDVFGWGGMPMRQRTALADAPSAYGAHRGPVLDLFPEYLGRQDELNPWFQALACLYQTEHGRPIADDCVTPYASLNPRVARQRALVTALLAEEPVGEALAEEGFATVALHADLFTPGDRARLEEGLLRMDPTPAESRDGGERILAFAVPGGTP